MPVSLDSLNIHIWLHISKYLAPKDLFSVALANKSLYETIGSHDIWERIVYLTWFSADDADVDIFRGIVDYFRYFAVAAASDNELSQNLDQMVLEDDAELILKAGWKLVNAKVDSYSLIPILNNFRRDRTLDYRKRWYASAILESIRKKQAMEFYESALLRSSQPLEEVFYKLSYLDSAFDDLLPYRNNFFDDVDFKIRNNTDYTNEKSMGEKIVIVIKTIEEIFNSRNSSYGSLRSTYDQANESSEAGTGYENYSILRVYAGEVYGTDIIRFSIIQKIASRLGIKSYLTNSFLVIFDETAKYGRYLVKLKEQHIKLYTLDYLKTFLRREGDANSSTAIHKMLEPVGNNFIKEFLYSMDDTVSLAKMLNIHQGTDAYARLYPISKVHYQINHYFYPIIYQTIRNKMHDSLFYSDIWTRFTYTLGDNPFSIGCFDTKTFISSEFESMKGEYIESFFNPLNLKFCDRNTFQDKPLFKIGQIVKHERVDFCGVITTYEKNIDGYYYKLFPQLEDYIIRESSLQLVERPNHEAVDSLVNETSIGRFFTRFDSEANCFVPDKHLLAQFPNL